MNENFFWDEAAMLASATPNPTILAIGDSWFWYPFPGGSLINRLGPLVKPKGHVIFAKGMNGAEAYDYVDGKYAQGVRVALQRYGAGLEAVFISGGGNDFAGFADLRPLLRDNCSSQADAPGCFLAGPGGLQGFLDNMDKYYRKLIGLVYTHTSLNCFIVMHSYDYAIPSGHGVFGGQGWLKSALVDAQVPPPLQQECVNYLLDAFHGVLANICTLDPGHLIVVDSRGTLAPDDWANELHPTAAGFAKIAGNCWRPALRDLKLAT
jgi:hypothetical protein